MSTPDHDPSANAFAAAPDEPLRGQGDRSPNADEKTQGVSTRPDDDAPAPDEDDDDLDDDDDDEDDDEDAEDEDDPDDDDADDEDAEDVEEDADA